MTKDKPFGISKWAVLKAWERVRANQGAAGVDDVSVSEFEKKLKTTSIGFGTGCRQGRMFHRRCDGS
jgi:hypothetical protein